MSRFSMTEDLRDCHADELPRTKSWLRAFVASQRFAGAARARGGERDAISHLRRFNREVRAGPGTGPRRVGPAGASRLLDADS